jgi:hypothetical protein
LQDKNPGFRRICFSFFATLWRGRPSRGAPTSILPLKKYNRLYFYRYDGRVNFHQFDLDQINRSGKSVLSISGNRRSSTALEGERAMAHSADQSNPPTAVERAYSLRFMILPLPRW